MVSLIYSECTYVHYHLSKFLHTALLDLKSDQIDCVIGLLEVIEQLVNFRHDDGITSIEVLHRQVVYLQT